MRYLEEANSQKVKQRLPKAGGMGEGGYCLMGMEFLFGIMKKFWKQIVGMIAQHCECT